MERRGFLLGLVGLPAAAAAVACEPKRHHTPFVREHRQDLDRFEILYVDRFGRTRTCHRVEFDGHEYLMRPKGETP